MTRQLQPTPPLPPSAQPRHQLVHCSRGCDRLERDPASAPRLTKPPQLTPPRTHPLHTPSTLQPRLGHTVPPDAVHKTGQSQCPDAAASTAPVTSAAGIQISRDGWLRRSLHSPPCAAASSSAHLIQSCLPPSPEARTAHPGTGLPAPQARDGGQRACYCGMDNAADTGTQPGAYSDSGTMSMSDAAKWFDFCYCTCVLVTPRKRPNCVPMDLQWNFQTQACRSVMKMYWTVLGGGWMMPGRWLLKRMEMDRPMVYCVTMVTGSTWTGRLLMTSSTGHRPSGSAVPRPESDCLHRGHILYKGAHNLASSEGVNREVC
ncbi:uncharacterized protein LOC134969904 [Pseudophryne corroboree]|uniref:uncharacterized protein LOC134969904 n=1 Tax=Pseudophryne corroboree TaxID=495146 RepID=UPI0030820A44